MSEKLEKIGGYVVNGQPQLAHDNTLKGTGLPDSPLGLNNETVLWEGEASSSVTLSEEPTKFDYLAVYFNKGKNTRGISCSFIKITDDTTDIGLFFVGSLRSNDFYPIFSNYRVEGTYLYETNTWEGYFSPNGVAYNGNLSSGKTVKLHKVVGINRKST